MNMKQYPSINALNKTIIELLRVELAVDSATPRAVILSGGRTPISAYDAIARSPFPVAAKTCIAYSDERHVPEDSPESNYRNSRHMLRALGIPEEHVLRVHTELPLEDSARQYESDLRIFIESGGTFPLALLGIGSDGHTCSLFTGEHLRRAEGHAAIPIWHNTGPHRVSMTPSVLERVDRVVFMVAGREKDAIVEQLIKSPESTVAGRAVARCPRVEIWRA